MKNFTKMNRHIFKEEQIIFCWLIHHFSTDQLFYHFYTKILANSLKCNFFST